MMSHMDLKYVLFYRGREERKEVHRIIFDYE
eukprot:UN24072